MQEPAASACELRVPFEVRLGSYPFWEGVVGLSFICVRFCAQQLSYFCVQPSISDL